LVNGFLGEQDLKRVVKNAAQKSGQAVNVTEAEIEKFACAMDMEGIGQIKIERLMQFLEQGATGRSGSPQRRPNQRMPSDWVPRVATLAVKGNNNTGIFIDPEFQAMGAATPARRRSFMRQRAGGVGLSINMNDKPARHGGGAWRVGATAGKVNVPDPTADPTATVERRRSPSPDKGFVGKITGEDEKFGNARAISSPPPPGGLNWNKVTHLSANTHADPEKMVSDKKVAKEPQGKVGGSEDRKPKQPRVCITEKVNESQRQLYQPKVQDSTNITDKLNVAGRSCTGWAQPYSETVFDKLKPMKWHLAEGRLK